MTEITVFHWAILDLGFIYDVYMRRGLLLAAMPGGNMNSIENEKPLLGNQCKYGLCLMILLNNDK